VLEAMIAAGGGRFRGIRFITASHPDQAIGRSVAALYRDLHRRLCAERAMFESNFPVDKGSCGYAALWSAVKRIAAGCSAAEKQALFAGTATKFYRLG
jgi:predicted TIM-barrel fold metal-dependent hydrolase